MDMKRYAALIKLLILLCLHVSLFAQTKWDSSRISYIESYPLEITLLKTTNIIFPNSIKGVDRGSLDILVKKGMGMENILQVKAAKENFPPTNLSVVTSDGKLYSFLVNYTNIPPHLNIVFSREDSLRSILSAEEPLEPSLSGEAAQIAAYPRTVYGIKDKSSKMKLCLTGLYIHGNVMYYQLQWKNKSGINYDIESVRFFIRDRKRSRRTATQETELHPFYQYGNLSMIEGPSTRVAVLVLPKLTITRHQYLVVEAIEKGGGRQLRLKINGKKILQAIKLAASDAVESK